MKIYKCWNLSGQIWHFKNIENNLELERKKQISKHINTYLLSFAPLILVTEHHQLISWLPAPRLCEKLRV